MLVAVKARAGGSWRARTDEVSVLKVEAVQLVAGLLSIHDIFVNDECGAFGVVGDALADLTVLCISVSHPSNSLRRGNAAYRTGPNLPKRSNSSSGVTL